MSIKKSLEDNKEEILKNLPKEFHAYFEKNIQQAQETKKMSDEEVKEAIKKEVDSEFHKDAEDIDSEINSESSEASEEEKEKYINDAITPEIKEAMKKEE